MTERKKISFLDRKKKSAKGFYQYKGPFVVNWLGMFFLKKKKK